MATLVRLFRIPLYLQSLIAMVLGVLVGLFWSDPFVPLSVLSLWIISALKWLAIPLLFFVITDTFLKSEFKGRHFLWMLGICLVNGSIAIAIALFLSNTFHPGSWMPVLRMTDSQRALFSTKAALDWNFSVVAMIVESPMILAILAGLFIGAILTIFRQRISSHHPRLLGSFQFGIEWSVALLMRIIESVTHLIPLAIFLTINKLVGKSGFTFAHGLGAYFLVCMVGMSLHIILCYHVWIVLIARISLSRFWREAKEPVIYAFGVNSSLATLPLTLKGLEKLGISHSSARLSACIGTNFNNDGILLYEVAAVLFIAQAYGFDLSLSQQLAAAVLSVIATVGVGGVPEAGIISLTLVLSTLHLPQEILPILLTVDWIVARYRSSTNVLGDMAVAIGLDAVVRQRS